MNRTVEVFDAYIVKKREYAASGGEFPELSNIEIMPGTDSIYIALIRELFVKLGFDKKSIGDASWNPLAELLPPGGRVVIKPNFVAHMNESGEGLKSLVTDPQLIKAILPYVIKANPRRVVIGDAPLQFCDFTKLMEYYDFDKAYMQRNGIELVDFRRFVSASDFNIIYSDDTSDRYIEVDLGEKSLLSDTDEFCDKYRVTVYDPRKMKEFHRRGVHKYLISRDIIEADLVINLPKLKTHKKAGITCCLKNLVGINCNKEYLPHHRKGSIIDHGDAYQANSLMMRIIDEIVDWINIHREHSQLYRIVNWLVFKYYAFQRRIGMEGQAEGNWYGNDTIWRTCVDLNRILIYADKEGRITDREQRRELNIVDAIMCGDGEGPLCTNELEIGQLIASMNPLVADYVACFLFRFDPEKVPLVWKAFDVLDLPITTFRPSQIRVNGISCQRNTYINIMDTKAANPHSGWKGRIEL